MKILIWEGAHDPLDGLIKMFTHGKGSHVAFLRADGKTIHEAFYPRVRDRAVTPDDLKLATPFRLEGLTESDHLKFEERFTYNLTLGIEYSIADLFRYAFNIPLPDEKHTFCSRYAMHIMTELLSEELWPLARLPEGDTCAPRDLLISPRLHEESW